MLPAPLLPADCLSLWASFCNELRAQSPETIQVSRTIGKGKRAGRTQEYQRKVRAIKENTEQLAKHLLIEARAVAWRLRNSRFLGNDSRTEIPKGISVSTNSPALARYFNDVHPVTMRRRITELMDLGVIVEKIRHGCRRNYELVINSTYLYKIVQNEEKDVPNGTNIDFSEADSTAQKGTKCSPIKGKEIILNTTLTPAVEKWTNQATEISAPPRGADAAGDEATPETGTNEPRGGAAAVLAPQVPQNTPGPLTPAERQKAAVLTHFVDKLFHQSIRWLWKKGFTAEQADMVKDAIAEGVYNNLGYNWSLARWKEYHQECMERVEKAGGYLERNPGKGVAWPYQQYTDEGPGYFDPANLNGFAGTKRWWMEDKVRAFKKNVARALACAEKEFDQYRQRARGVKAKCSERVKKTTDAWHLYHYHLEVMKQFRNEEVLQLFADLVSRKRATA